MSDSELLLLILTKRIAPANINNENYFNCKCVPAVRVLGQPAAVWV